MTEYRAFNEDKWTLPDSDAYCASITKSHYENFIVGSWILPKPMLKHIYALYSYCRSVDDLGDEDMPPYLDLGDPLQYDSDGASNIELQSQADDLVGRRRLNLLDQWELKLKSCYAGTPEHPIFVSLQRTIVEFNLPIEPFLKLIEANRMDQKVHRYSTYNQLLDYCDHSANPVGRLFLGLFGYHAAELHELSDATCTALQLTNFWQDVRKDYLKGRVYIPLEDWISFGCTENDLGPGTPSENYRQMMKFQESRTMEFYRRGSILTEKLDGDVKLDVALFSKGGMAILETIKKQHYDVFTKRPTLSKGRKIALFINTWLGYKLKLNLYSKRQIQ